MVTTEVLGSRTPLPTEISHANVLTGPSRRLRPPGGVHRQPEEVLRTGHAILHRLLGVDAGRRRGLLAGESL
jgi:hypothetical protein